ncbi:MAG: hypothetical protein GX259_08560 [Bacteroidales bacterium]|nr:hypothetical protein [Bacteroidales bacterium]
MRNLIKLLFLFLVLFSITTISKAQDTIVKYDQIEKMIQDALLIVLKSEKDYIEKGIIPKKINDNFYIWIDHYPFGFEPTQEILDLNLKIKYISKHSLTKKQKKKGIDGIGFSGVRIDGNKIKLYFSSRSVFLKNKILYVGIDGEGYLFEYEYSCEKQEWILTKMPRQIQQ